MTDTLNPVYDAAVSHLYKDMHDGSHAIVGHSKDPWVVHAEDETLNSYGDTVSASQKKKSLLKFGENLLVGTAEATVMTLGASILSESYVSTNAITNISSSSASDTGTVTIEGHTISAGVFTFVVQSITLNGQTTVALGTPLARVSRAYNNTAADEVGSVYVYESTAISAGVPSDLSKAHIIIPVGENQSLKAATTISNSDYAFITQIYASLNKKTAGFAIVRLKIRNADGVFQTKFKRGIQSAGADLNFNLSPYLIVPKNADVIITAEADAANTPVSAGFNAVLASVIT